MEREAKEGEKLEGNDRYEGYCADLAKKIAAEIGITYTIRPVEDDAYGSQSEENGTWNGMVGQLVSKVSRRECHSTRHALF